MKPDGSKQNIGEMNRLEIRRDPQAPSVARRGLDQLPGTIDAKMGADAELLLSDLVSNSLVHGSGEPVIVLLDASPAGAVRCEVVDEGEGFVPRGRDHAQAVGGWGLDLVDRLAGSWGVREGSTHVWFELEPPEH